MGKRPPNHPDRFNPATPDWMRNSPLSTRLVNVLVAGGVTNEELLREMIGTEEGRRHLWAFANMGQKGMGELRDWAAPKITTLGMPFIPARPGRYLTAKLETISIVFVDGSRAVDSDGYSYESGVWQDEFSGERGNNIVGRAPDDWAWCRNQARIFAAACQHEVIDEAVKQELAKVLEAIREFKQIPGWAMPPD